jgi:nucleotide-binding universal stress UspA family protein
LDLKIQSGKIYKEVVGEARHSDASLIVAGTHGVSGFEALFIGSNAFRIVTASECPVLSINHEFKKNTFSRIVLPIDTSRDTRQKVPFTADLARVLQAEVIVLGVYNYADENVKNIVETYCRQAVEHLQEKGVKIIQEFVESRRISEVVIEYAQKVDADLISIMSDIDSNAFARMLGGEAQRIVNASPIPVLCSHADENFNYEISFRGITG